mmetsp:Transcript_12513/g.32025  ORF Transcript_12513/g.32025 Transcript_12513/m.32025 type:complete len:103 (-) Transcript_12513:138-446(-)
MHALQIHRRDHGWSVLVKTESEAKEQNSAFWHHFHTFREANSFCEELKLQYVRMEQRTLLADSLARFAHRTESAICMDKVFQFAEHGKGDDAAPKQPESGSS